MIRRLLLILILPFLIVSGRSEVRHLIIVDISHSMAPRKQATINMVRELVASGFQNQIHAGDKYGMWVYNEHNYWKRFPLQTWDPAKSKLIAEVAAQFLAGETFENRSRFDLVAADLERLFSGHGDILLNIITDGETGLSGIDYDIEINTEISNYRTRLGPGRKPFMINLLALKGKIQAWRLYLGEGELDLPKLPPLPDPVMAKSAPEQKKIEEPKKVEEPKKEEKPPVVVEMPPGAKVVVPKPVESPAPAPAPAPVIVETSPVLNTNSPAIVAAITPQPKAETAKAEPQKEQRKETPSTTRPSDTNTVAVAAVDKTPSQPAQKIDSAPEPAPAPANKLPVVAVARTESSATGPLFYCIAALGFLLPIAAVLLYVQRRNNSRGSIISQSMLRDFKSGLL